MSALLRVDVRATLVTYHMPPLNTENKLVRVTLRNLPELQIVEIRENRLETLTIENAPKLKHLQLSFNELKSIEGLSNLSELETLYVRNNLISSLDGFAVANKKLLHLNLR